MPSAPAHAGDARELGHLRGRRGQVEAHHVVDHDAVGEPVMQVGHRGQRVRARVHGAQVLLERDRAHHRAHQHVAARLRGSRPSRTAIGSARAAMRTPSSAMPSHSG